jgi:hypothetical protein
MKCVDLGRIEMPLAGWSEAVNKDDVQQGGDGESGASAGPATMIVCGSQVIGS